MRALGLVLLVAACDPNATHPCDSASGSTCVNFHLHGDSPAFDTLQVDLTYEVAQMTYPAREVLSAPGGSATTPAVVGVVVPPSTNGNVNAVLVGFASGKPVWLATTTYVQVTPGSAVDTTIDVQTNLIGTGCYVRGMGTDVVLSTCGVYNLCPLCELGQPCSGNSTCITNNCGFDASEREVCQ